MNLLKRILPAVLAAALVLGTGCSTADTTWVYRYNDITAPAGLYIINMISAVSEADSMLAEQNAGVDGYTAPTFKELLNETVDGVDASDWITADARDRLRKYFAVEEKYAEMGLTLDEADRSGANSSVSNVWASYSEVYTKNGIAESSLRLYIENEYKKSTVFNALYGEGGQREVTEEQLQTIFANNYAKTEYMLFVKPYAAEGEESSEEASAEILQTANEYLERLKDGEAIEDLIYEKEQAEAADPSTVTKPEAGERSFVVSKDDAAYYGETLVNAVFDAKMGEPVLVDDDTFIYLIQRVDILEDSAEFEERRDTLLNELKEEEFEDLILSWADSVTMEANQAALDRYLPSNLKLD